MRWWPLVLLGGPLLVAVRAGQLGIDFRIGSEEKLARNSAAAVAKLVDGPPHAMLEALRNLASEAQTRGTAAREQSGAMTQTLRSHLERLRPVISRPPHRSRSPR